MDLDSNKMKILEKTIWDYKIQPPDLKDPNILRWYLERKINSGDWVGIKEKDLKNNLSKISIDPEVMSLLKEYFKSNDKKTLRRFSKSRSKSVR